jgi:uncharacterized membrane protein HdeD (DUF308 family)
MSASDETAVPAVVGTLK